MLKYLQEQCLSGDIVAVTHRPRVPSSSSLYPAGRQVESQVWTPKFTAIFIIFIKFIYSFINFTCLQLHGINGEQNFIHIPGKTIDLVYEPNGSGSKYVNILTGYTEYADCQLNCSVNVCFPVFCSFCSVAWFEWFEWFELFEWLLVSFDGLCGGVLQLCGCSSACFSVVQLFPLVSQRPTAVVVVSAGSRFRTVLSRCSCCSRCMIVWLYPTL
mgnify:CR=1 FL=1